MTLCLRLFSLIAFYWIGTLCLTQTDGFIISNIRSNMTPDPRWEPNSPQVFEKSLFNMPFHYLSSGGQSYVFASLDGKHVIKFFKHHRLQRKPKKLERDFNSYIIAKNLLENQTGLVYVHLNKTHNLNQTISLVDKLGISHKINLDEYEFIVQKRVELVFPYLEKLIRTGQEEKAHKAIDSLLSIMSTRSQLNIYDEDARIQRNFGFLEDGAIILDVGRLRIDPSKCTYEFYKKDTQHTMQRLLIWLQDISPSLSNYLETKLHEI